MDEIDPNIVRYLEGLVRVDLRKKRRSVEEFQPREGQDPEEASEVLAQFRGHVEFREHVLAKLREMR